jgi:hypothetical protein
MADERHWDRRGRPLPPRERAPWERSPYEWRERNWEGWHEREREDGRDGRGYGGLNDWSYRDRGQGRVFDRGEDYGRADPRGDVGRAGEEPRGRPRDERYRGPDRGRW